MAEGGYFNEFDNQHDSEQSSIKKKENNLNADHDKNIALIKLYIHSHKWVGLKAGQMYWTSTSSRVLVKYKAKPHQGKG